MYKVLVTIYSNGEEPKNSFSKTNISISFIKKQHEVQIYLNM